MVMTCALVTSGLTLWRLDIEHHGLKEVQLGLNIPAHARFQLTCAITYDKNWVSLKPYFIMSTILLGLTISIIMIGYNVVLSNVVDQRDNRKNMRQFTWVVWLFSILNLLDLIYMIYLLVDDSYSPDPIIELLEIFGPVCLVLYTTVTPVAILLFEVPGELNCLNLSTVTHSRPIVRNTRMVTFRSPQPGTSCADAIDIG